MLYCTIYSASGMANVFLPFRANIYQCHQHSLLCPHTFFIQFLLNHSISSSIQELVYSHSFCASPSPLSLNSGNSWSPDFRPAVKLLQLQYMNGMHLHCLQNIAVVDYEIVGTYAPFAKCAEYTSEPGTCTHHYLCGCVTQTHG